jgi:hypothetical protein
MILGMSVPTFTLIHVIISLIAIVAGLPVLIAMLRRQPTSSWTSLFLGMTVLTSVTGFLFHSKFGPPHVIGVISLFVLAIALYAFYGARLAGRWRAVYVVTALTALYLNVFVAVVQTFQKVAFFHALAPTQAEPPFAIAQGIVLLAFVAAGVLAVKRFNAP